MTGHSNRYNSLLRDMEQVMSSNEDILIDKSSFDSLFNIVESCGAYELTADLFLFKKKDISIEWMTLVHWF